MALVAKITGKSGKAVRNIALTKGRNVLHAEPDAVIVVVDEATGKVVEDARIEVVNGQVNVIVPESAIAIVDSPAGSELASGGAAPEMQPDAMLARAESATTSAKSLAAGGAFGNPMLVAGGLIGLGGIIAAAASGGKSGGKGGQKTPRPIRPRLRRRAASPWRPTMTRALPQLTASPARPAA